MIQVITADGEILHFDPTNPPELEQAIVALGQRLEELPGELAALNEAKYDAERAWQRKRNAALDRLIAEAPKAPVTQARARAELEAADERQKADVAKTAWHYATDSLKTIQARYYGLLNLNKANHAAMIGRR